MPSLVERPIYLEQLKSFREKELIKVVTGIRRCGKSTLFDLYCDYLIQDGVEEKQIIRINLEDPDYHDIKDYMQLYKMIKEQLLTDKMNYIFWMKFKIYRNFKKQWTDCLSRKTAMCILLARMHICCPENWRHYWPEGMWKSECCHCLLKNMYRHWEEYRIYRSSTAIIFRMAHFLTFFS